MNTELRLFKQVDGVRREVRLTIDEHRTIIDEQLLPIGAPGAVVLNAAPADMPPHLAQLAARGIKFHTDGLGRVVIDSVPQREQEILSFFNEDKPCWFGGCTELRKRYLADLAEIGGTECTDCDKGAVLRKFIPLVDELLPR